MMPFRAIWDVMVVAGTPAGTTLMDGEDADHHRDSDGPSEPDPQQPTPEMLLWAYCRGIFPMADPLTGLMCWYDPDPRGILPLDGFHTPGSLARVVKQGRFEIRSDTAFEEVIRACARPRHEDDLPWIDERLQRAYVGLHQMGFAHSVEAWREKALVGGLYGVQIGGAFFGESMFINPGRGGANASKVCLVHLVRHMIRRGCTLLDTQFHNHHLAQFGCREIPRREYLWRLSEAIRRPVTWGRFPDCAIGC